MGVERGKDLRDRADVAVDELAEAARVVERARAGAAADEELEAGRAERVLDVDDDERDPEAIGGGRPQRVLLAPARRVLEPRRVVDAPHLADALGSPVGRQRERRDHGASVAACSRRSSSEPSRSPSGAASRSRAATRPADCSRCSRPSAAARASARSGRAAGSAPPGSSRRSRPRRRSSPSSSTLSALPPRPSCSPATSTPASSKATGSRSSRPKPRSISSSPTAVARRRRRTRRSSTCSRRAGRSCWTTSRRVAPAPIRCASSGSRHPRLAAIELQLSPQRSGDRRSASSFVERLPIENRCRTSGRCSTPSAPPR